MGSTGHPNVFRVAIVGGGIGGLFCALSIHHHCQRAKVLVRIDVYEQAAEYKEIGAGVGLGVNAARLIHRLGLGTQLNAIGGDRRGVWFSFRRFDNSEDIITIAQPSQGEVREAPCARSNLLNMLLEAVETRQAATLHKNKACMTLEEQGDTVDICFRDGSKATANLVVGCDGIHSAVRNQFADDKPVNSGTIAYRGVVPIASLTDWPFQHYNNIWAAKHKHFLTYPITKNKDMNIVAFVTKGKREVSDVKESWTSICDRKDVEEDFREFDKPVQQIISLMEEKPSRWRLNDREPLLHWHFLEGKVVVLGDAAHAMLPHMGAGAGQAIEDAWMLGRALRDHLSPLLEENSSSTLKSAMQFFQDLRLPRAQKVQANSRIAGNTYEMQTEEMAPLTYDECIPILAECTKERMKWVWNEDIDEAYEHAKSELR
ncbi:hypothetical protein JX266_012138 [Neoarthrinium moseri]|nr:hypothetical protein JX266_012138 [Neoarthrinium moseri]